MMMLRPAGPPAATTPIDPLTSDIAALLHRTSTTIGVLRRALDHSQDDPELRSLLQDMLSRDIACANTLVNYLRVDVHGHNQKWIGEPW